MKKYLKITLLSLFAPILLVTSATAESPGFTAQRGYKVIGDTNISSGSGNANSVEKACAKAKEDLEKECRATPYTSGDTALIDCKIVAWGNPDSGWNLPDSTDILEGVRYCKQRGICVCYVVVELDEPDQQALDH